MNIFTNQLDQLVAVSTSNGTKVDASYIIQTYLH